MRSGFVLTMVVFAACSKTQSTAPAPAPAPAPVPSAELVPPPPDPGQSISGTITLPAARKRDVAVGNTIFLIARRAGSAPGQGLMLAVQRLAAGEFPMRFTLSGRDAMIPGTPFHGTVSITARVDKDGDGLTRKKGDVFGQANDIKVGTQDLTIPLDTLQTEDVTLGGSPPAAGMPPGHP